MFRVYRLIALAAILGTPILNSQTTTVSEPVFGIQYNPAIVHFEKAPPLIGEACKDMRGKKLYVYAHLTDHETQYFIVQEYLGEFGVAVAIRGMQCAEIDSDRFLYEGIGALAEQGITAKKDEEKRIMDGIAANILTGYSKAFGGEQKLLAAIGARADNLPPSALRTELEQYKKAK
jgi:hypothetical protein